MREILFRGKRIDNGEWVYGYFIENESDIYRAYIVTSARWETDDDGDTDLIETDIYEVDPATVGQYTSLTDKNGVKIFEGDILSRDCYDVSGRIVKIVYSVELAEFCAQTPSGYGFSMLPPNGKVIGNIHDNPELMEETT